MDKVYLYIGHIMYGRNNIYEESLLNNFKKKGVSLDVVSINKAKYSNNVSGNENIRTLKTLRKPIADEIIRFLELLFLGVKWCLKHKNDKKFIIMLSPSIEVGWAVKILSRLFHIKSVNLIIDTALGNILSDSIWDRYIYRCYKKAEEYYKDMSASMALNKNVFKHLQLNNKPCLLTKIGHNLQNMSFEYIPARKETKIIVYTGTLTYYDGTEELLQAMSILNPREYVLHIYGKGPDEDLVRKYQQKYSNIKLMGYLPNEEMKKIMKDADLLVNPRIDNKLTDIFGFPSKMIEYLLSGTPVLTTEFAAMPEEYRDFVYIIKNQTGEGVAEAIKKVFENEEVQRENKCQKAYEYVYHNNKYEDIVDNMLDFIGGIK